MLKYLSTLPSEWQTHLQPLQAVDRHGRTHDNIDLTHFPTAPVQLLFEDGSRATFEYSFYVVKDSEVCVLTEHCGYHVFYAPSIERMEGKHIQLAET